MVDSATDRSLGALVGYRRQLAVRRREDRPVQVFDMETRQNASGFPGGSMYVVSGRANSPELGRLRELAADGDAAGFGEHVREVYRLMRERAERDGVTEENQREPWEEIAEVPVLTQVSYRGRVLADGLFVNAHMSVMPAVLPFEGGHLDPEAFVASHFLHEGTTDHHNLETIVVIRQPELTDIERRVLAQIPAEVNQITVGDGANTMIWGHIAEIVAEAVAAAAAKAAAEWVTRQLQHQEQVAVNQGQGDQQELQLQAQQDQQDQQDQQAQQDQQQGQQDQQQGQQDQQQGQQDQQAQVDRQAQQDQQDQQAQQDQGGQDQQQDNGGSLSNWLSEIADVQLIESLSPSAAVATLLQIREQLVMTEVLS